MMLPTLYYNLDSVFTRTFLCVEKNKILISRVHLCFFFISSRIEHGVSYESKIVFEVWEDKRLNETKLEVHQNGDEKVNSLE